jgi:hypothetical protein
VSGEDIGASGSVATASSLVPPELLTNGINKKMQKRRMRTSIIGIKKRVTLRFGY